MSRRVVAGAFMLLVVLGWAYPVLGAAQGEVEVDIEKEGAAESPSDRPPRDRLPAPGGGGGSGSGGSSDGGSGGPNESGGGSGSSRGGGSPGSGGGGSDSGRGSGGGSTSTGPVRDRNAPAPGGRIWCDADVSAFGCTPPDPAPPDPAPPAPAAPAPAAPAAPPLPSAAEVAQRARDEVPIQVPRAHTSPDGVPQITGLKTWYWMDRSEWTPVTARAELPGIWAEVTATPTKVVWTPGDGTAPITCTGPARPHPGTDGATTDCGHVYTDTASLTLRAAVTYTVTWRSSTGETGTQDAIVLTTNTPITIEERQVVTD